METNYELKLKNLLVPLKAILLVLAMVLVGFTTYAQQGKTIKVANDQQLIEALKNPSVSVVELSAGYYPSVNYTAKEGTRMEKAPNGGGRNLDCQYYIFDGNVCVPTAFVYEDPEVNEMGVDPIPPGSYYLLESRAGANDPGGLCGCCPLPNTGTWSFILADSDLGGGDTIYAANLPNTEEAYWYVTGPGVYSLRYSWGPPYNSFVQTEYVFRGPNNLELDAPDVCGTSTTVDFVLDGLYSSFTFDVEWVIQNLNTGLYYPVTGPNATGQFNLDVTNYGGCGQYELIARVYTHYDEASEDECYTTISTLIDFACGPQVDAGPDVWVCNDLCYSYFVAEVNVAYWSPEYTYSWYQVSGPGTLEFNPDANQFEVGVCREVYPPVCSYGTYEVEFQVQNGECYAEDDKEITFYQQPTAIAGVDRDFCNEFAFSLEAVPFVYCGTEGVNYWAFREWELIASPAGAVVTFDESNPVAGVTITGTTCLYGEYTFRWSEANSKAIDEGCFASDEVTITIYEDPQPDAGNDLVLCETFAFSLYGAGDDICYQGTEVTYTWEKTSQPGDCEILFTDLNVLDPQVTIGNCNDTECKYGKYTFTLIQSNSDVCFGEEAVDVWIFQEPVANAGGDQNICYDFDYTVGFNLNATFFAGYCGTAGVNYMQSGQWTFVDGPTNAVTFADPSSPTSGVSIDMQSVECPYGAYTFRWTEYNGFGTPFQGCEDYDEVVIYISESPESVDAGANFALCNEFSFDLNGVIDMPCTQINQYKVYWTLVSGSNPGGCTPIIMYPESPSTMVQLENCNDCPYGEYVFEFTQENGYYDEDTWVPVCENSDLVTVTIYQQPVGVDAGMPQNLCNDFTFDLTADGADYCGVHSNWYSWTLVSQPGVCNVSITNPGSLTTGVVIDDCDPMAECNYGEYVFKFTEWNGDAEVNCEAYDLVSVFIFEAPDAEAGMDVNECLTAEDFPYCVDLAGEYDYCYSMNSLWTKTCGPGLVQFEDPSNPNAEVCVDQPGRYKFNYKLWNVAEGCEANDEVIFDLLEQPEAITQVEELTAECDELCVDIVEGMIVKFDYIGTDEGECPNFQDFANWSYVDGPVANYFDATTVTFSPDDNPVTNICASYYGGYTVRWTEVNKAVDGLSECSDYVDIFIEFYETPTPDAGPGGELCGNCFTLNGVPYAYLPYPNQHQGDYLYWESLPTNPCAVTFANFEAAVTEVCIPDVGSCYGEYGFVLHQMNGECFGTDTVWVTFKDTPPDFAICYSNNPNDCGEFAGGGNQPDFSYYGCLQPLDVLEVCAEGYSEFYMGPWCYCEPGFDWYDPANYGWSFEWSLISPSGTLTESQAGYYDYEAGEWVFPYINIIWGECCDTARLYLTATNPEGCERTLEYKMFVYHKPCIDIEPTDLITPYESEVGMIEGYCNNCPPNPCLLYNWTAEHCGIITEGQGTECIEVLWTDYNVNGGIGEITLTVFDTCTGCCNYDEIDVKIYPTGTLGTATLSGYVKYENNSLTPLNGVEVTLWNAGVPVMTTTSFNDIEGGNGMGYYVFNNLNAITPFGITANYTAPWYGANATDALAVELKSINELPGGFYVNEPLQNEAMDVNNINNINGTDALWIKQRAINMVGYFPAGNWAYVPGMTSQAGTYDVKLLTMGDANRTNIPNSMKAMPAIDLVNDGMMNVVSGEVFELPIRIAKADVFGAMTLHLEYNSSLLEVIDVVAMEGMLSNISNGTVSVAWSNLNPMALVDNDVVITLKAKAIGEIASTESLFRIGMESEFADPTANVIEPVTLKSFGVTTDAAALDYFLSSNRPNPFSTTTTIEYTMPETGKVKLSVLDMLGQELAVLVESTQKAGRYQVEFSAAGLATGVYLYKITVDGETRDFISTQRMVVSH